LARFAGALRRGWKIFVDVMENPKNATEAAVMAARLMLRAPFFLASKTRQFYFQHIAKKQDYGSEMSFWESLLDGKSDPDMLAYSAVMLDKGKRSLFFPREMPLLVSAIMKKRKQVSVLEIGSGPMSLLAHGVDSKMMEVTAVDPLAGRYSALLAKHGIDYPIRPIAGTGEALPGNLKTGSFDIVYMSNSLDHTELPGKVMKNACELARAGGFIFVEGSANEGTNAGWSGLHQHDLFIKNGELMLRSQNGRQASLSGGLGIVCVAQRICTYNERFPACKLSKPWFSIVFQKDARGA